MEKVQPVLAVRKAGRRRVDDRKTVAGIVLSLRTGCPGANFRRSRQSQHADEPVQSLEKDGTIDRITAALGFTPPTDFERHQRQRYGTYQREKFKRDGFNPWLFDRDDDTALGKLAKQWESGKR